MREDDEQPSPSIVSVLWQYRLLVSLIVVVFLAGSTTYGFLTRGDTTATAKMVLATPNSDDVVGVSAPTEPTFVRYVAQRAIFVTSQQVLDAAAEKLDGISSEALRESVTAAADSDGSAILVTASAGSARRAASIANQVVAAYRAQTRAQVQDAADSARRAIEQSGARIVKQLGTAAAATNSSYQALSQQASEVSIAAAKFGSGVTFTDPATADAAETPGLPIVDIAAGLLLGLLAAATVSWLLADARSRGAGVFATDSFAEHGGSEHSVAEESTVEPPVYEPPVFDAPVYDVPAARETTMEWKGGLLRTEEEATVWTEPEPYGDVARDSVSDPADEPDDIVEPLTGVDSAVPDDVAADSDHAEPENGAEPDDGAEPEDGTAVANMQSEPSGEPSDSEAETPAAPRRSAPAKKAALHRARRSGNKRARR